jgi:hypothetical protein
LRLSQCVFAAGSIAAMTTTTNFFNSTSFWYYIIRSFLPYSYTIL